MKYVRKRNSQLTSDEIKSINELIANHNGLVFHEIEFNKIVSDVFSTQLSFILAFDDQELVGFCPLHNLNSGLLERAYSNPRIFEVVYGGWIFNDQKISESELIQNFELSQNESLTYWSNIKFAEDSYLDDKMSGNVKNFAAHYTAIVDLTNSEEFLWTKIVNQKRRNIIRKALKNEVKIKRYGPEGLDIYYPLMVETNEAVGVKVKPREYFSEIFSHYWEKKRAIIIIAELNNEPIAGVLLVGNQNVMHYWQGASKRDNPNLGQGDLLQWEAIKWAQESGCHYYDLCGVEKERLPHIAKFKMGFSKDLVPFYGLTKRSLYYKIASRIQNVIKAA